MLSTVPPDRYDASPRPGSSPRYEVEQKSLIEKGKWGPPVTIPEDDGAQRSELFVWSQPDDEDYEVDIIAVHNFNGGWGSDWVFPESRENLMEIMGRAFPTARVMTFEYDSDLRPSRESISKEGLVLWQSLEHDRRRGAGVLDNRRPTVFVGNRFGGNIIKQALLLAEEQHRDGLAIGSSNLAGTTAGIVFLATLHLENLTEITTSVATPSEWNSGDWEWLASMNEIFRRKFLEQKGIRVASFYYTSWQGSRDVSTIKCKQENEIPVDMAQGVHVNGFLEAVRSLHPILEKPIRRKSRINSFKLQPMSASKDELPSTSRSLTRGSTDQGSIATSNFSKEFGGPYEYFIPRIIQTSGLPGGYRRKCSFADSTSVLKVLPSHIYSFDRWDYELDTGVTVFPDDWRNVPATITDELHTFSYVQFLQQGVLIRDKEQHTALVSIADAAQSCTSGLHELLECLLHVLSHRLEENAHYKADPMVPFTSCLDCELIPTRRGAEAVSANQETDEILEFMGLPVERQEITLLAEERDGQLKVGVDARGNSRMVSVVYRLLRWLDMVLDGANSAYYYSTISAKSERRTGCWRKKILNGPIIIAQYPPIVEEKSLSTQIRGPGERSGVPNHSQDSLKTNLPPPYDAELAPPYPFPNASDCLVLTASSLWDLFDDSLERLPNCRCSFKSPVGEVLQCLGNKRGWYLWHVTSPSDAGTPWADKPCEGRNCRVDVKLVKETSPGETLMANSPCVLGWYARTRRKPEQNLWRNLESIGGKDVVSYTPDTVAIQGNLGAGLVATPGLTAGVTLKRNGYKRSPSSDTTAVSDRKKLLSNPCLIYCEERGVHLAVTGYEVAEHLSMQELDELDCTNFPYFKKYSDSKSRMQTWESFSFQTNDSTEIAGKQLIDAALKKMDSFLQLSRQAQSRNRRPLYWKFQDLLFNKSCSGFYPSGDHKHKEWINLTGGYCPLILAVGSIDLKFLTSDKEVRDLIWDPDPRDRNILISLVRHVKKPERGGIFINRDLLERWLRIIHRLYAAEPVEGECTIKHGTGVIDFEVSYTTTRAEYHSVQLMKECQCKVCRPPYERSERRSVRGMQCLHYLQ